MKILLILLAGLVVSGCASKNAESGEGNAREYPLNNPGFEQAGTADSLPGWIMAQHAGSVAYAMQRDTSVHVAGNASFRVARIQPQIYGGVSQIVPIPDAAGKTIEFSAMLRTRDVGPLGWVLALRMPNVQADSTPLTGNSDWTRVYVRAEVPAGVTSVTIYANLLDAGTGWIDEARVRSIKP